MNREAPRSIPYTISQSELNSHPTEIGAYKFGDRVERANLASFLATGIMASNGVNTALGYYFEKAEFDTGLNITASARAIEFSGGLKVLSKEERSIIFDAYRRANETQDEELPNEQILKVLNELFTPGNYKDRNMRLTEDARNLQGRDFLDWLDKKSLEMKAAYAELSNR